MYLVQRAFALPGFALDIAKTDTYVDAWGIPAPSPSTTPNPTTPPGLALQRRRHRRRRRKPPRHLPAEVLAQRIDFIFDTACDVFRPIAIANMGPRYFAKALVRELVSRDPETGPWYLTADIAFVLDLYSQARARYTAALRAQAAEGVLSPELYGPVDTPCTRSVDAFIARSSEAVQKWHGRDVGSGFFDTEDAIAEWIPRTVMEEDEGMTMLGRLAPGVSPTEFLTFYHNAKLQGFVSKAAAGPWD
ncbi:unnamed protein product [Parascedosporium putredinis]|uniref:Uncharacterized protein n=1 Tax=Parascedosporium putredinis TaxID=1442378 RepID=A0A9P1H0X2_9PEZI|nr:unnamed protein product [Parascedosporium putredinis]CAI7992199.1 unnamed protein product [Parascedosporium putredinis]